MSIILLVCAMAIGADEAPKKVALRQNVVYSGDVTYQGGVQTNVSFRFKGVTSFSERDWHIHLFNEETCEIYIVPKLDGIVPSIKKLGRFNGRTLLELNYGNPQRTPQKPKEVPRRLEPREEDLFLPPPDPR